MGLMSKRELDDQHMMKPRFVSTPRSFTSTFQSSTWRVCEFMAEREAPERIGIKLLRCSSWYYLPFLLNRRHRQPTSQKLMNRRTCTASMRFATSSVVAAAAAAVGSASAQEFLFTGTNQAGAEFGETTFPGQLGKHYTWPTPESIDVRMQSKRA